MNDEGSVIFERRGAPLPVGWKRPLGTFRKYSFRVVVIPESQTVVFEDCFIKKRRLVPTKSYECRFAQIRAVDEKRDEKYQQQTCRLLVRTGAGMAVFDPTLPHYELIRGLLWLIRDNMPIDDQLARIRLADPIDTIAQQREEKREEKTNNRKLIPVLILLGAMLALMVFHPISISDVGGVVSIQNQIWLAPVAIALWVASVISVLRLSDQKRQAAQEKMDRLFGLIVFLLPIFLVQLYSTQVTISDSQYTNWSVVSGVIFEPTEVDFKNTRSITLMEDSDGKQFLEFKIFDARQTEQEVTETLDRLAVNALPFIHVRAEEHDITLVGW